MTATETTTTTLRATARQNVIDSVGEAAVKDHERNYHRLHVRRDGTVTWFESISKSSDIIDEQASGFQAVPSVCIVGTGSVECSCMHCGEVYSAEDEARAIENSLEYDKDAKYATREEAIVDAIAFDLSDIEDGMLEKFDALPAGYFSDEEEVL